MDLSHLVTIGLWPAKRAPLSGADLDYFAQHGVDKTIADLIEQLAKQKPADPYKFIAEAASKLAKSGGGAQETAPKAEAKPKAEPKAEVKAEPKAKAEAKAPKVDSRADSRAAAAPSAGNGENDARIGEVGTAIRELKEKLKKDGVSSKDINDNADVKNLVAELQALKAGGGSGAPAAAAPKAAPKDTAAPKEKAKKAPKTTEVVAAKQPAKGGGMDVKKADDVPEWYAQVIMKSELIEQYPVKGCFILRPWAYKIWESIQGWLDCEIKKMGVDNCYFPMFIPKCYMDKESEHLADFAPELAMVTKIGDRDIDEPVAIRPTSETAMYAAFSNWVQSHRDLPVKCNQWCSVVRWEVKQTTPFLRTREFLWQEGHTAYADKAGAEKEVLQILELYARVYEDLLAVPVVRGTKTKAETFPGADYTMTVENFIPATGRAIQGATSHHLGQNFSKMFDITFQDPADPTGKKMEFAFQNSWGMTQRTIGVMIMVHGDDRGLVLPPRIAGIQVVIVPVGIKASSTDEEKAELATVCMEHYMALSQAGLRVKLDDDTTNSPGWRFNHWEMKGVPLRIELGPMDLKKGEFVMAKRNVVDPKAGKSTGKLATLVAEVKQTLEDIHSEMYQKALDERAPRLVSVDEWKDFSPQLNQGRLVLVPFCGEPDCEEVIKNMTKEEAQGDEEVEGGLRMGAKSLCVPHEEKYNLKCPTKCINPACKCTTVKKRVLFGRSY